VARNNIGVVLIAFCTAALVPGTTGCEGGGAGGPGVDTPPGGCWDYWDNAVLHSARGCVDWAPFGPNHQDRVELELEVTSSHWSGTVRFDNTP
jgi:hypothetical protein